MVPVFVFIGYPPAQRLEPEVPNTGTVICVASSIQVPLSSSRRIAARVVELTTVLAMA